MTDAYHIVDGINKSHSNDSLYDILAEDLKKCKDTILKMINSSNVCAKQDTKKTDADNATVCDKQDTNNDKADTTDNNNNDKPDTKVKDKLDTMKKDAKKKDSKPDTKVKDKPDTKVKDKEDIESSASKNEPQKTLSNGEPAKIFDSIKEILKCFVCEKFMNEKFSIRGYSKDEITLCLINKPKKGFKIIHVISICRDTLSLNIEKVMNSMKENRSNVEDNKILLDISQTEKDSKNKKKLNIMIQYIMIKSSMICV